MTMTEYLNNQHSKYLEELKSAGYPVDEVTKKKKKIYEINSLEEVKELKQKSIIKWHDVIWETSRAYTSSGKSHITETLIPIVNGKPEREPLFKLSDGYYRFGEHFHVEEEL